MSVADWLQPRSLISLRVRVAPTRCCAAAARARRKRSNPSREHRTTSKNRTLREVARVVEGRATAGRYSTPIDRFFSSAPRRSGAARPARAPPGLALLDRDQPGARGFSPIERGWIAISRSRSRFSGSARCCERRKAPGASAEQELGASTAPTVPRVRPPRRRSRQSIRSSRCRGCPQGRSRVTCPRVSTARVSGGYALAWRRRFPRMAIALERLSGFGPAPVRSVLDPSSADCP